MSDYISREELKRTLKPFVIKKGVMENINAIPSADVRENIPVKFIPLNADCRGYTETFRCSRCGCDITAPCVMQELDYDFCPWCGGKAE